jgi:hypothetical protein
VTSWPTISFWGGGFVLWKQLLFLKDRAKRGRHNPLSSNVPIFSHWQHCNCGHNVMQGTCLAQADFLRRKCVIITWSATQHGCTTVHRTADGWARRDDWGAGKATQQAIQQLLRLSVTSSRALRKILGPLLTYRIVTSAYPFQTSVASWRYPR